MTGRKSPRVKGAAMSGVAITLTGRLIPKRAVHSSSIPSIRRSRRGGARRAARVKALKRPMYLERKKKAPPAHRKRSREESENRDCRG